MNAEPASAGLVIDPRLVSLSGVHGFCGYDLGSHNGRPNQMAGLSSAASMTLPSLVAFATGSFGRIERAHREAVMGTPETDPWAPLAGRFARDHYATIRGRVRTHVIDAHLRAHLPPAPAAIVDVGGGAGNQSIPLARRGYLVTIVDPSPAMLAEAESKLADEAGEVTGRVRLVQATASEALAALDGQRFAGVLCHGVIMYVDDPAPFTAALAALAEAGGIVSLVAKNAACLAVRPALDGRWEDALVAFDGDRQVNGLGLDTRADTVDGLTALLGRAGVDFLAWYGVRLFTDGWTSRDRSAGERLGAIFAVELEASRRDPYRRLSRLFHLVGVRR
jgi:S-adenosylmethionine-dependent methyltransferase